MVMPAVLWIANMPGPKFLGLYLLVIVATLLIARMVVRADDQTADLPRMPIPATPDPYEIACLRGGYPEMVWLALFSLTEKGYVETLEDGWQRKTVHPDPRRLPAAERELYEWLSQKRSREDLLKADLAGLRRESKIWEERFRVMQMKLTDGGNRMAWRTALVSLGLICGLGAFKLIAALMKGRHNVGGIVFLAVVGTVAALVVCTKPKLTTHGRRYLKDWEQSFETLKAEVRSGAGALASHAALLAVGVYGVSVLSASPYERFRQVHAGPVGSGDSSSGGCGSSSGCGGGGCGGGGCGGCS